MKYSQINTFIRIYYYNNYNNETNFTNSYINKNIINNDIDYYYYN